MTSSHNRQSARKARHELHRRTKQRKPEYNRNYGSHHDRQDSQSQMAQTIQPLLESP